MGPTEHVRVGAQNNGQRHNAGWYKSMGTIGSSDFSTIKDLLRKTRSKREPTSLKILFIWKKSEMQKFQQHSKHLAYRR